MDVATINKLIGVGLLVGMLPACVSDLPAPPPPDAVTVFAVTETDPVATRDDAADDPAIWVNRSNPQDSRVIATDKDFGLEVYDLSGAKLQRIAAGRTNNVDLRYFPSGSAYSALAAASNRTTNSISLFLIDHQGRLTWLPESDIATGLTEPYGLCMFANSNGMQVFVNDTNGSYQQWLLDVNLQSASPQVSGTLRREFRVPSQPEGCVADDEQERLFLGVEAEGVYTIAANYRSAAEFVTVADIDGTVLAADVEGMSLYLQPGGGYLVVSSQGNYSYAVYDRLPPFTYRGSFVVGDFLDTTEGKRVDGTQETDGLDVSSVNLGGSYERGVLIVQDGYNTLPSATQNFKYIPWQRISEALSLR